MTVKTTWKVTLNFRNGETQPWNFPNKEAARHFLNTVVFKNEDCINATVVREDEFEHDPSLQSTLDSIQYKLDLVKKILSKV
jgi:hypothetical protein